MINAVAEIAPLLSPFGSSSVAVAPVSIHYGLQLGVRDAIAALATQGMLPDIDPSSVQVRKVPYAGDFGTGNEYALPAVLVFPGESETIDPGSGTNAEDDYGYPVALAIFAGDDSPIDNHDQYLSWREVLIRHFHHQRLSINSPAMTFYDCLAEPGPIVDWSRWAADASFVSGCTLRFFTRLARGNS